MRKKSKTIIILSFIVLAAILLRLLYLWQFSTSPLFSIPSGPDTGEYDNWAREILKSGVIPQKLHIHAPLYPSFLAALYSIFSFNFWGIRLFQTLLIFTGFGVLTWGIHRFVAPRQRIIAWIFLALAAIYPPLLFFSSEIISETLLLPLVCLTITLLYWSENELTAGKFRKGVILIALSGLCAGLMAITHPISLLFIGCEIILLAFLSWRREKNSKITQKLLAPVIFAVMVSLIIAPVCFHNSKLARRFTLIQQNTGFNLYLGHNPKATGTCYLRPGTKRNKFVKWAEASAAREGIDKDKFLLNKSFEFMLKNPLKEAILLFKKTLYVWNFRELTASADTPSILYFTKLVRSGKYLFILLGSLSICGIIMLLRKTKNIFQYRHFLLLLITYWLAQIVTVTSGRYRLAMYPPFFIFAAFAIDYLLQYRHDRKRLLKYSIAFLTGLLIVTIPSPPHDPRQEEAETHSIFGEACYRQGNFPQAAKHLREFLKFDTTNAHAYNLLGVITERTSPSQALKYFNLALKNGSDDAVILYNYGWFLERQAYLNSAIMYLEKCLKIDPSHDKALNLLGVIHIKNKNLASAIKYLRSAHKLDPNEVGVMFNLAVALYQNRQTNAAVNMLRKIISKDPAYKPAKLLLARLQK